MSDQPTQERLEAALRHYDAMRRAQSKYYNKKMDAKGPRRKAGRPKKVAAEGVAEGSPPPGGASE